MRLTLVVHYKINFFANLPFNCTKYLINFSPIVFCKRLGCSQSIDNCLLAEVYVLVEFVSFTPIDIDIPLRDIDW